MPIQSANTYSAAINLIHSKAGATFEVTKEGGIREQTKLEKFSLFASKLVRSFDSKKDSKDASVAKALQDLYQKHGGVQNGPLQNIDTKRFFEAQNRIDLRNNPKRSENVNIDKKALGQISKGKGVSKTTDEPSSSKIEISSAAKVVTKKTIADYASLAPRAIIDYDHSEKGKSSNLKGVKTEWELGDIYSTNPDLIDLLRVIEDKSTSNPSAISAEEFRWLRPGDKLENRDLRFKAYTPARIQKANIIFNDRLKIALYEIAQSQTSPKKLTSLVKESLEGIAASYGDGSIDVQHIKQPSFRIDFNKVQLALSEAGLIIGEGELAEFAGAEFDVVKWSEKVGEAPIPKGAPSPLVWNDLSRNNINDRELSTVPFDKRNNHVQLVADKN